LVKKITIFGIFGPWIFFVSNSLLGHTYNGGQDGNIYLLFWLVIFCTALLFFIKGLFVNNKYPRQILNLFPVILIFVLFGISFMKFGFNPNINVAYFKLFVALCVTSFLFGIHCALLKGEKDLFKSIEFLALLSIPAIISTFINLIKGTTDYSVLEGLGGMGRMGIAYSAAQMFTYFFFIRTVLKNDRKYFHNNILDKNYYSLIRIIILILCAVTIISSGTRGALLVIITIPVFYYFSMFLLLKNKFQLIKRIIPLLLLIIPLLFLFKNFMDLKYIEFSLKRFSLFFSEESRANGNWAGGSGRENIYPEAFNLFTENPIFGLGPFGFFEEFGTYPHNLILELLADYGIIGALIGISFLGFVIFKFTVRSRYITSVNVMFMMFLAELLRNMFSGTFYTSYILWFFIGYALAIPSHKKKIVHSFQKE
jgi:O-antigen ligase